MRKVIAAALVLAALPAAAAKEIEVVQKNKKFSIQELKAKVGDTIVFRNDDPFFHNIFSLSTLQSFDLGSFPQGEARKLVLKNEGTLEVECAIHPDMKLKVQVAK